MDKKNAEADPNLSSQIMGERSSIFDLARGRLSVLGTFFIILYIIVAARVTDLAVVQGTLLQIKDTSVIEDTSSAATLLRGDIIDRNGVLLATTLKTKSLYVDSTFVVNPEEVLRNLLVIFPDLSPDDIYKKLTNGRRFSWIKRDLTPEEQRAVLMIGEPALGFKAETRRIYPQENLAAHFIGYTDVDGHGLAGVERAFESSLNQGDAPLQTTLDIRLQYALYRELDSTIKEYNAKAAIGIIMDVKSGEVLAGGSLPMFNPNDMSVVSNAQLFNRLTLGVYELGSIFKIFSTAAFLNEGAGMGTEFDARKPLKYGRFTIHDYHAEKRFLTIPEIFLHSSNIGSALMGEKMGTETLRHYYRNLGLLDKPDFDILEVGAPLLPSPWRDLNTLTAAYGHGLAVSALQMASAVATSVGDGTYVSPKLVLAYQAPKTVRRVFTEDTTHKMRQLLRLNALDGTGKSALVAGYQIGGKTGTAEKIGVNGGYDQNKKISSFVSVFPIQDPQYLVLVIIDEPHGTTASRGYATGGWVAAPAAEAIVKDMVRILGMKPVDAEPEDASYIEPLYKYLTKEEDVAGTH